MNECMQIALSEAQLAAREGEVPVGAAVFKDGKLIAKAHNLCEQTKIPWHMQNFLQCRRHLKNLAQRTWQGAIFMLLLSRAQCAPAPFIFPR